MRALNLKSLNKGKKKSSSKRKRRCCRFGSELLALYILLDRNKFEAADTFSETGKTQHFVTVKIHSIKKVCKTL